MSFALQASVIALFLAVSTHALRNQVVCGVVRTTKARPWATHLNAGFGKLPDAVVVKTVAPDEKCMCGSGVIYETCCKAYHEGSLNDPSSLIRSRYSAYATSNIDYIISTTSKTSSDHIAFIDTPIAPTNGLKRWAKSIRSNMLDQYRYVRMEVDSMVTSENGVEASVKWRHLAIRKGDNLMFPIEEVSALLKTEGKWTYVKGDVVRPDPEMSQVMMSDWPAMIGLELKVDEEKASTGPTPKQAGPGKRNMMDYEGSKKFKPKMTQNSNSQTKNSERSGSP